MSSEPLQVVGRDVVAARLLGSGVQLKKKCNFCGPSGDPLLLAQVNSYRCRSRELGSERFDKCLFKKAHPSPVARQTNRVLQDDLKDVCWLAGCHAASYRLHAGCPRHSPSHASGKDVLIGERAATTTK